jgi:hypothetical protein
MPKNNQTWLEKIRSTQILKHLPFLALGILSWLGFSYLFLLFLRLGLTRSIYNIPWAYDAPLWSFLHCLIGAAIIIFIKWKFALLTEKSRSLFRDFLILLSLIPTISLLITFISIFVLGMVYAGGKATIEYEILMGFLSGFILQIFVAMTCIGYFYLTLINQTKERLLSAQQSQTELQIKMLQQNIEPHFLFNNLNVLSSLIESNPKNANRFLDKLAELYRYILQTQNVEIVPIQQELDFAENYLYLLKERFGNAYNFEWKVPPENLNGQMIVPTTLQNLLENVVKHNAGDPQEPLQILVKLDKNSIVVENEIRPKSQIILSNGTGLENLQTRYSFLTEKAVEIVQDEKSFKVKLPLLEMK